jgi:hypothetical protein
MDSHVICIDRRGWFSFCEMRIEVKGKKRTKEWPLSSAAKAKGHLCYLNPSCRRGHRAGEREGPEFVFGNQATFSFLRGRLQRR